MTRIDAHQHFWQPARGDYTWLEGTGEALAPLRRDFLPDELAPLLRTHGVAHTVLVQAAESVAETEFMLGLASRHDFIGGVVGWVDLSDPEAAGTIAQLAERPALKGLRPMLQDLPEDDWIERAPQPEALRALQRHGLCFDALVKPRHLAPLLRFVHAWPDLPVVIDHAAKPPLAADWHDASMQAWRHDMAALAAQPQVSCKLSGLLTEMAKPDLQSEKRILDRLFPVVDVLLACFGPERLMWGSDWPVLTLAAGYDAWVSASDALLAPLAEHEQAQVLHETARRFYDLD
jgi:L-fuconolactonase